MVTFGETVCEKLKIIYFEKQSWKECHQEVVDKFTQLKKIARKFYVGKSELEMLQELSRFSFQDLEDAFDQ